MVCYDLNGKTLVVPEGVSGSALIVSEIDPETRTTPAGASIIQLGRRKVAASLLSPRQTGMYTSGKTPVEISKEKKREIEKVISILKQRI